MVGVQGRKGRGLRVKDIGRGRKSDQEGFPGGSVVKNPPASAGDTGSIPGPGGSHVRSPCTATREKPGQQQRPSTAKNKEIIFKIKE